MDNNSPCFGIHNCDGPEQDTENIDNEKLAQIRALGNRADYSPRVFTVEVCRILGDKPWPCCLETPSILETFRKIIIKYPCHKCHAGILREVLSIIVDMKYTKELNPEFRLQVQKNIYLNRRILNQGIVALSSKMFLEFIPPVILKLERLDLLVTIEILIARFGPEWRNVDTVDLQVCQILDTALRIYKAILIGLRTAHCLVGPRICHCPNEQVQMGLARAIGFNFRLVSDIAILIVEFAAEQQNQLLLIDFEEVWRFYDSFTQKIFEAEACEESFNAIRIISKLHRTLFAQSRLVEAYYKRKLSSRYITNVETMLVVASELKDHCEILHSYGFITQEVLDALSMREDDLTKVNLLNSLFEVFHKKILEILEEERGGGQRDSATDISLSKFRNECRDVPKVKTLRRMNVYEDFNTKCIDKISESIKRILGKGQVREFDFDFLQALICAERYTKKYDSEPSIIKLLRYILVRKIASKSDILNTGIAKIISDRINGECHYTSWIMTKLLELLRPTAHESEKLKNCCTAQQALSIPYVVRDKAYLIQIMYPEGINKLTEQLRDGKGIESLLVFSQTLNMKIPPWNVRTMDKTIPSASNSTKGTRLFVLDDGTKIRCKTEHLIEHSEYFSSLLDGGFREATMEEIQVPGVTEFQFTFLLKFINCDYLEQNTLFDMDFQQHLDLIVVCDRLSLPKLCKLVAGSFAGLYMKESSSTLELLLDFYEAGLTYGVQCLRDACLELALNGSDMYVKMERFRTLYENTSDRDSLVGDVKDWLMLRCGRVLKPGMMDLRFTFMQEQVQ